MHELSLCRAVAGVVSSNAAGRPVREVRLQIGHFRQVVPSTLQFCWGIVTDGTDLGGCGLRIEHVPAVARCRGCGAETTLEHPVLVCAPCGGRDVELLSGEEFLVHSMELAEAS